MTVTMGSTLSLGVLSCIRQEDWTGSDDIRIELVVDGVRAQQQKNRMSNGSTWAVGATLMFKNSVRIELWEEDSFDPNDLLGQHTLIPSSGPVGTLSFTDHSASYGLTYSIVPAPAVTIDPIPPVDVPPIISPPGGTGGIVPGGRELVVPPSGTYQGLGQQPAGAVTVQQVTGANNDAAVLAALAGLTALMGSLLTAVNGLSASLGGLAAGAGGQVARSNGDLTKTIA